MMGTQRLTQRQAKMVATPIIWTGYGILLNIVEPLKRTFIDGLGMVGASFASPETFITSGLFGLVGLVLAIGWTFTVLFAVFTYRLKPFGVLFVSMWLATGGVETVLGLFTQELGEGVEEYTSIGNLIALSVALVVSLFTAWAYCYTARKLWVSGRLPSNDVPSRPRCEPTVQGRG